MNAGPAPASSRAVVLLTGMSGTGKSTTLRELAERGHAVLDTDEPGWIVESATSHAPEPLWDLDRMAGALTAHRTGSLFVAGCVMNQGLLYDRFDAVVLLSAPLDVLLARVADRVNPFGSAASERAKIARDLSAFESALRAGSGHEIVTTTPVGEVAVTLERIAARSLR